MIGACREAMHDQSKFENLENTMIKVWGRRNSSNVMPVMWAVAELGLEHERINVGGSFGGLDTDDYGQRNPNRLVPTIEDDDLVLWESNAILRYLAARYGAGTLWPENPIGRARADQWMEWGKTTFYPAYMPIFWQLIRVPEGQQDMDAVAQALKATAAKAQMFDAHLEGRDFVAGEHLTMGDLPLGAMMYRYLSMDIERPSLPNVERWYASLCERPGYQTHVMIPFGSNNAEWIELEKAGA